jgi:hypothetical protein
VDLTYNLVLKGLITCFIKPIPIIATSILLLIGCKFSVEFNIGTIGVATLIMDEIYDSTTIKSFLKFCKFGDSQ